MASSRISLGDLRRQMSSVEMQRMLECPVCLEIPVPPIKTCKTGHHICNYCSLKVQACSQCQEPFGDARNYPLEQIVLSSFFSCPYSAEGCRLEIKGSCFEQHLANCQFRPRSCPVGGAQCSSNASVLLSNVKGHLMTDHDFKHKAHSQLKFEIMRPGPEETPNGKLVDCAKHLTTFDGCQFILSILGNATIMVFVVLLIGTEKDVRKYQAKITLMQGTNHEVTSASPIQPLTRNMTICTFAKATMTFKPVYKWEYFKAVGQGSVDGLALDVVCKIRKLKTQRQQAKLNASKMENASPSSSDLEASMCPPKKIKI